MRFSKKTSGSKKVAEVAVAAQASHEFRTRLTDTEKTEQIKLLVENSLIGIKSFLEMLFGPNNGIMKLESVRITTKKGMLFNSYEKRKTMFVVKPHDVQNLLKFYDYTINLVERELTLYERINDSKAEGKLQLLLESQARSQMEEENVPLLKKHLPAAAPVGFDPATLMLRSALTNQIVKTLKEHMTLLSEAMHIPDGSSVAA